MAALRKNIVCMAQNFDRLILGAFRNFKMRTRLFWTFFILLTGTMLVISYWYYHNGVKDLVQRYGEETYRSLIQTNTIIDLKISKIVENSELLATDKDLIEVFSTIDPTNQYDLVKSDRELKQVLARHFTSNEWIYSYTIVTGYYNFGEGYIPYDKFRDTELYRNILNGKGRLVWQPTYDFVKVFEQKDLENCDVDSFRYLFACGRLINPVDINGGNIRFIPVEETPMLVVNFRERFLYNCYQPLLNDDTVIMMVSPDKRIVSASEAIEDQIMQAGWLDGIINQKSGIKHVKDVHNDMIVCFCTSELTGWTLVSMVDSDVLASQAASAVTSSMIQVILILFMVSFFIAFLMSTATTRPINKLIQAIGHTERGDFSQRVPFQGHREFDQLICRFNDMNEKIQMLIHENYEVKLNEKENQIRLLLTQLNPHFIYNTLNMVNCIAIENNCGEIVQIVTSLSNMLRYTVDIEHSTGKLEDELKWLEGYIYIMSCRYEQELIYHFDIQEDLYSEEVPRLFLQPFLENAFIHGFQGRKSGCRLTIYGWRQNGKRFFAVEDNGRGFEQSEADRFLRGNSDSSSVGIRNVHQRLKLMYGEEYGVSIETGPGHGTKVILQLP